MRAAAALGVIGDQTERQCRHAGCGEGRAVLARGMLSTEEGSPTLSAFGAFLNLAKINWGVGMMSMPFYLYSAGLWVGLAFFFLTMVLTNFTIARLIRGKHALQGASSGMPYTELVGAMLGGPGRTAALFSVLVANYGAIIAYTRWLGDNLHTFLPEAGFSRTQWIVLVSLPLGIFVVLVNDVSRLKPFSVLGLLMGQGFAIVVLVTAFSTGEGPHGGSFMDFMTSAPAFNPHGFPVAMGIAVFCNEGMVIMSPQVEDAMDRPELFHWALRAMSVYFALNYMAVAVAGNYLFPLPHSEMSLNFSPSSGGLRAAVLLYAVQLMMSYVLVNFVFLTSVEARAAVALPGACGSRWGATVRTASRLGFVVLASALAEVVPNFGDFIALGGAVGNSLGIYILPHLCFIRMAQQGKLGFVGSLEMAASGAVMAFGAVTGIWAAAVSLRNLAA